MAASRMPLRRLLAVAVPGEHVHRRDDVRARLEDALEVVEVRPVGHVRDAVGLEREQRVDVVGGRDAERLDAAQLADVAPDLLRRVRVAADEVEHGVADHAAHGRPAGLAGRPLDDRELPAHRAIRSGRRVEVSWSARHTRDRVLAGRREARPGRPTRRRGARRQTGPVPRLSYGRGRHLLGLARPHEPRAGPVERVVGVGPVAELGVERLLERVVVGRRGGPDEDVEHVDAVVAELGPERLGEDPLERLARVVGAEVHRALRAAHRADHHDATATALDHLPTEVVAQHDGRAAVDVDAQQVEVEVALDEPAVRGDGGVVDEQPDLEVGGRRRPRPRRCRATRGRRRSSAPRRRAARRPRPRSPRAAPRRGPAAPRSRPRRGGLVRQRGPDPHRGAGHQRPRPVPTAEVAPLTAPPSTPGAPKHLHDMKGACSMTARSRSSRASVRAWDAASRWASPAMGWTSRSRRATRDGSRPSPTRSGASGVSRSPCPPTSPTATRARRSWPRRRSDSAGWTTSCRTRTTRATGRGRGGGPRQLATRLRGQPLRRAPPGPGGCAADARAGRRGPRARQQRRRAAGPAGAGRVHDLQGGARVARTHAGGRGRPMGHPRERCLPRRRRRRQHPPRRASRVRVARGSPSRSGSSSAPRRSRSAPCRRRTSAPARCCSSARTSPRP